jgi:hypothetical protein
VLDIERYHIACTCEIEKQFSSDIEESSPVFIFLRKQPTEFKLFLLKIFILFYYYKLVVNLRTAVGVG